MKKTLSFLLVCVLIFSSVGFTVQANPVENEVIYTLSGYGIIDANEQVDMNAPVTRGEFAGIVTRLMCINESASQYTETPYWDVPADYKFASDISILTSIGIFSGFSDVIFRPNDYVTYEQALKILVLITGYGDIALRNGGWPAGYEYMATKNRMLGGVTLSNPFSRAQLYKLIYNTLDVKLVGDVIKRGESDLEKTRDTLRSQIADKIQYELYRHKGVIIANSFSYTTAPYSNLYEDEVVIENSSVGGNFIYSVGNTNAFDLLGCEVEFYARKTDAGYVLLSIKPTYNNEVIEVDVNDFGGKVGNKVSYKSDGNHETLELEGDFKIVENGNRVLKPAADIFEFNDGTISFINNDNDPYFELVLIWKYENAIATSYDGKKIVFSNNAQYRKLTSLATVTEKREVQITVTDKNGNTVESFDTERTVSIFTNSNKTRYRIVVSDEIFEGTISKINKNSCTIGENEYKLASSLGEVKFGVPYMFYIDYAGRLAFAKEPNDRTYGFIMDYAGGFLNPAQVKMIIPVKVDNGYEINEEDGTVASEPSYLIMQNDSTKIFNFADKVRSNGKTYKDDEIIELLEKSGMRAVSYKLNDEGKINELNFLEKCGGDNTVRYFYHVGDQVFGGPASADPKSAFAVNGDTLSICVPIDENNNIRLGASEDDMKVKIKIEAKTGTLGYRVEGYDYNPETKKARLLVTYATMDASAAGTISDITKMTPAIVVGEYLDFNEETNENVRMFELLQRNNLKTLTAIPVSNDNRDIERVREGDLITFVTNSNDLLSNVNIIASLPDIFARGYYEWEDTRSKISLGRVGEIIFDEIESTERRLIAKIDLYTDEAYGPRSLIALQNKGAPIVYLYDSNTEKYESATLYDIIPETDKIFVLENKGSLYAYIIIIVR